jgi:hypothetical protein
VRKEVKVKLGTVASVGKANQVLFMGHPVATIEN